MISSRFLTKDYPRKNEEWIDLECPENLPSVSVEDVRKQLMKILINKTPGPNDPVFKILKDLQMYWRRFLTIHLEESIPQKYGNNIN